MEEQEKPQDEQVEEQTPAAEEPKEADRPEENFKAELARKNAEIARLRALAAEKEEPKPVKYDEKDITTWDENSLKMLSKSPDPNLAHYREQAEDLLLERKLERMAAKRYEAERKASAHQELEAKYPEALDPTSEMAQKISKVMQEYDLSRTPAGRLVAAKIVASEGKESKAKGQSKEDKRIASVKGQLVDGDRPKPTEPKNPKGKIEDVKDALMDTRNSDRQVDAVSKILKERGMDKDNFFKRR